VPSCRPSPASVFNQPGRYAAFLFTRIHNFWV
jgi:hypothetical protein